MAQCNDDRFDSDLYEGRRTLFIHDNRKCPQKKSALLWLFCPIWCFFGLILTIAMIAEGDGTLFDILVRFGGSLLIMLVMPPTWCLIILGLQAWWAVKGQQTLRIDGEQIRHDWWAPWGKGSKIWPRDHNVTVEVGPGDEVLGNASIVLQFGKNKFRFHLTTLAEAEWLCEKVRRFLGRTRASNEKPSAESPVKFRRGKISDADSGFALVQSFVATGQLEINGETLQHIESGIDSHLHQKPAVHAPIPVRCGRCHAFVPPEHVLADLAMGQCVECGTLFSIPELERGSMPQCKRIKVERYTDSQNGDTLRVTQGGDFSVYPLVAFFGTLFGLITLLSVAFFIWQCDPSLGLRDMFPEAPNDSSGKQIFRFVMLAMFIGSFLLLPLWAFLERRTMTLDRDYCRFEVRLLFFRWRRVIPRNEVRLAERSILFTEGIRDICRLCCGNKKSFCFTFSDVNGYRLKSGSFWLRGEINRFLYAVPADDRSVISSGVYLGGMQRKYEILQAHCPHCNHIFAEGDAFDLSQAENHCPICKQNFAAANFVKLPDTHQLPPDMEGFEYTETPERLEVRQHHPMDKKAYWGNIVGAAILIALFSSLILGVAFSSDDDVSPGVFLILGGMCLGMSAFFVIACISETLASLEWQWRLTIDSRQFELVLSYKNREKRIVVPLHEIRSVEYNNVSDFKFRRQSFLRDKLPTHMQYSSTYGQHLLLHDGTRIYLPSISAKPQQSKNWPYREWFLSTLNAHIMQKRIGR